MEYIIRACEERDLQRLIELCANHADYERSPYSSIGKLDLLKVAFFGERQKLFCWVIEVKGKLAGYFSYTFDFSTWDAQQFLYLDCLYLEPEVRGQKIGEAVFGKLTEIARANNCVNIQWQTPSFNERAIKFYNRMGGIGEDKVRFTLDMM
jgi:ribosomal protein S18 acetylase RimI-like enzyme